MQPIGRVSPRQYCHHGNCSLITSPRHTVCLTSTPLRVHTRVNVWISVGGFNSTNPAAGRLELFLPCPNTEARKPTRLSQDVSKFTLTATGHSLKIPTGMREATHDVPHMCNPPPITTQKNPSGNCACCDCCDYRRRK